MAICHYAFVTTPIPKGNKNISCSQNYRAIALASSLSKILEHLILDQYASFFHTSYLQFGFMISMHPSFIHLTCNLVLNRVCLQLCVQVL